MSGASNTVLVTGGTGKQGGATVQHLLERRQVRVRVLTRNPTSREAKTLASRGVELVRGDFGDARSLAAALSNVSAAFSVQRDGPREENHGKAFADAVKAAGTPHLVYASLDGAERKSGIPHYESKWRIEQHIRSLKLPTTVLRPVAFMDNFLMSSFPLSLFLGLLKAALAGTKRVQLVSTLDVGWFAARALENPSQFIGREIALAGDELSVNEIVDQYHSATGTRPRPFPVPRFMLRTLPNDISSMLIWFAEHGFRADITALRNEHPELKSFSSWLRMKR